MQDFFCFIVAFLLLEAVVAAKNPKASLWLTLSGSAPVIIAKGGFSGIFPDSSSNAYQFAQMASSPDTKLWCDVQLTKDSIGICLPDVKLNNCTDIFDIYPNGRKVYLVNGVRTAGWFSVDYNVNDIAQVSLTQGIYSRTEKFDLSSLPILAVEDVAKLSGPSALWLNIEHDIFYHEHNLSMRSYVLSVSKRVIVSYVSSPEIVFLQSIVARFKGSKTKLIFRFLGKDIMEPSTNQTYGSLSKNLTFIKSFASGILVPKHYIWPLTPDIYLQPHTSIVMDAHKAGLEVFASDFANDAELFAYNYSYDPIAEYLSYVDNGAFSVDGVLTDHPLTASEAIGCYSHIMKNSSDIGKPIIISHNGASGIYPDCTDLAYQQAVSDGADFIDCTVQVTQDSIPICMSSINLMVDTTVTKSPFSNRLSTIPEILKSPGIFTFNLTWEEIQKNLSSVISSPEIIYLLERNPRFKKAGNFMKLSDFLSFAKDKELSGVVIKIENAAFLAERLGFSVVDAVITAVTDSGYNNQPRQQVMIQSSDSQVLLKFKQQTEYRLNYLVDKSIRDADNASITDIKRFAESVAIDRDSIYPRNYNFITEQTGLVKRVQAAGLAVYVYVLRNEFTDHPWDFLEDPYVEINAYYQGAGVDGVIVDFPRTTKQYRRNACASLGNSTPQYMQPIEVGQLLTLINSQAMPPATAPAPVLDVSDVAEPPLPPVPVKPTPAPNGGSGSAKPPSPPSSSPRRAIASLIVSLAVILGFLLLI